MRYASDTFGDGTSTCYQEAAALGFDVKKSDDRGQERHASSPRSRTRFTPMTVSFVEITQGAHNQSVHPSGNYLYNSNSDLITSFQPAIEIFDISNFAAPIEDRRSSRCRRGRASAPSRTTSASRSDGTRAYSAALSQGVVIDTRTRPTRA